MRVDGIIRRPGEPFTVGNKLMVVCTNCLKLIRIDKPFVGSLHICAPDKEDTNAS